MAVAGDSLLEALCTNESEADSSNTKSMALEAQQRYSNFSCRAMLVAIVSQNSLSESLRIYPCPMVSIPLRAQKTLEIKGFLGLECPFLDLVSQTLHPRGRGGPLFADSRAFFCGVSHNYRATCWKMGYRTDMPV